MTGPSDALVETAASVRRYLFGVFLGDELLVMREGPRTPDEAWRLVDEVLAHITPMIREQIAAEIDAYAARFPQEIGEGREGWALFNKLCGVEEAARIARGGAS